MSSGLGSQIDPESFAHDLTETVLPGILSGRPTDYLEVEMLERLPRVGNAADLYGRHEVQDHATALLAATAQFRPPPNLVGANEAYTVLIGAVAFRAATSEMLAEPDVHERYQHSATWVCTNFGSIIWWNCD